MDCLFRWEHTSLRRPPAGGRLVFSDLTRASWRRADVSRALTRILRPTSTCPLEATLAGALLSTPGLHRGRDATQSGQPLPPSYVLRAQQDARHTGGLGKCAVNAQLRTVKPTLYFKYSTSYSKVQSVQPRVTPTQGKTWNTPSSLSDFWPLRLVVPVLELHIKGTTQNVLSHVCRPLLAPDSGLRGTFLGPESCCFGGRRPWQPLPD